MAANDFKIVKHGGPPRSKVAEDRTTSSVTGQMLVGEPLKLQSEGATYVIPLADGDPEAGTDIFEGVCARQSDELAATTQGTVIVTTCLPIRTVVRAKVTTTTNLNTAAKLEALVNNWITATVTGVSGTNGIFTLDEAEATDEDVHGFGIIGGNITDFTLDFVLATSVTMAGPTT